jgi:UDP-N-acetylmuramoyl-tripeptide--D-alanyl-D-alanine ligase
MTMAPLWTSDEIAKATGGTVSAPFAAQGVTFDSREVEAGHLFIALKGEVTDGHRFIDKAAEMGASGQLLGQSADVPHILVNDTTVALNALGLASRQRTAAKIIGVTGSVGKTGTKEALAAALQRGNRGAVHRSVKSYNNHTGVPLSLARMPAETSFGVFEMGMNQAGELAQLTQLVRPHVAMVTWIASAHREFFDSEEAIADAKGEIFQGLESGGTAIIPFDSIHRDRLIAAAKPYAANIITFGRGEGADVRALDVTQTQQGTRITAKLPDAELHFTLAPPGDHWVNNALGILAAVQAVGGDLAAAGLALAELEGLAGRGAQHNVNLPTGGAALVIDESYNANPASMRATLNVLAKADGARKIVVLGEMRELGHESDAMHAALADPIVEAGAEIALLVGDRMSPLAKALEGRINVRHCANADAAIDALNGHITNGDALLIKGSNAVGLSRVVAALVSGVSGR